MLSMLNSGSSSAVAVPQDRGYELLMVWSDCINAVRLVNNGVAYLHQYSSLARSIQELLGQNENRRPGRT
ncbi:hypothetical protein RJT34_02159 [Clitoria ternatea]|uniref:Uncharacterized protein n=1 Tax=Clitoria ternatea TaxID=43366 RepID=A0AAN9KK42_CLITE